MTTRALLPAWADDVLRRWGPQPARGASAPDAEAATKYTLLTERFRTRWDELDAEVWPLFGTEHVQQAQHLLGVMIDLARYGSLTELKAHRQALVDVGQAEDEVRDLLDRLLMKLDLRAHLMHDHLIDGGMDDDAVDALRVAAAAAASTSWREPRLHNTDFYDAIDSRKTARDALNAMLYALDRIEPLLQPVALTDRARVAIFNVAHDAPDADYGAENIKKARADLRKRG